MSLTGGRVSNAAITVDGSQILRQLQIITSIIMLNTATGRSNMKISDKAVVDKARDPAHKIRPDLAVRHLQLHPFEVETLVDNAFNL